MKKLKLFISLMLLAVSMPVSTTIALAETDSNSENPVPLAKAHAHNDYEHERPFYDALDHGFTSVEADVWLEDGELLVAHDQVDVKPDRTLKSLYLEPLKQRVKQNEGSVYKNNEQDFLLWIDIKSEDVATYKKIHEELADYQKMLTKFSKVGVEQKAVTVIISGNRPRAMMESQPVRYAAYDGRMSDLETQVSNTFLPVISDNWTKHFSWQGVGEMPSDEREKLHRIVETAHKKGQIVRFWATPDLVPSTREAVWNELMKADVDVINTDHLPELQEYLMKNDSEPTKQHIAWQD